MAEQPIKPEGGEAPKLKIRLADKKSETARVELSGARPPENAAFQQTLRIEPAESAKSETSRVEPTATSRLDGGPLTAGPSETRQTAPAQGQPTQTSRVDASVTSRVTGETAGAGGALADTRGAGTQKVSGETRAVATPPTVAGGLTVRITSEEKRKSETARIQMPVGPAQTSRVTLPAGGKADTDDVFKQTIPMAPAEAEAAKRKTGPIKPVDVSAKAAIPVRMSLGDEAGGRSLAPKSETSRIEVPIPVGEPVKKSETARLDIPAAALDDRPQTRPKTIRIKRPDGTSAKKTLTISRPSEEQEKAAEQALEAATAAGDTPGVGYGIVAMLTVLVTAALIWVLLAQTYAPTLPFYGKIQ